MFTFDEYTRNYYLTKIMCHTDINVQFLGVVYNIGITIMYKWVVCAQSNEFFFFTNNLEFLEP